MVKVEKTNSFFQKMGFFYQKKTYFCAEKKFPFPILSQKTARILGGGVFELIFIENKKNKKSYALSFHL
ncbi:MAG: hypothetical protein RL757_1995 [Bacteroidota bacterium]|jgi:hypothetical protein